MTTIVAERADAHFYDAALERHPYFSWGAALAGAFAGFAVTFMLLVLGAGLGLMLVGPISDPSTPLKTVLTASGIYFFAVEAFGFAVGGYVAGRLCGPVLQSREEEIFRSGAHGLVVWAATVVAGIVFLVASAVAAANSAGNVAAMFGMSAGQTHAATETAPTTVAYWADTLLRVPPQAVAPQAAPAPAPAEGAAPAEAAAAPVPLVAPEPRKADPNARAELDRILTANAAGLDRMSADDRGRARQIVAEQTGVSQTEAQGRVDALAARVHDETAKTAEIARKAGSYLSIWTALSLLFGLLVATGAAVLARMEEEEKEEKAAEAATGATMGLRR
jgi:hypothetical protein